MNSSGRDAGDVFLIEIFDLAIGVLFAAAVIINLKANVVGGLVHGRADDIVFDANVAEEALGIGVGIGF